MGNKIAEKIVKPKPVIDENSRNVEEIVIPPEKRQEIFKKLRQVLTDSNFSIFLTRKWIEINGLSFALLTRI